MKFQKLVALLPMKANSERVPGKNFRSLGDKPLYRWILDTLLSLDEVTQVVINTDAERELRESGLQPDPRVLIRERKAELCGDLVSMNLILEDDLQAEPADAYLMTHTTNPLLSRQSIQAAIESYAAGLAAGSCDSLFSVTRFQTRFYRGDGSAVNHDPKNLIRTQDLEPWYEENSNLYLFTRESFARTQARIGEKPLLFETSKTESIDIDDWEDWRLAESLITGSGYSEPTGSAR